MEHVQYILSDILENELSSVVNVFYVVFLSFLLNYYISLSLPGYVLITAGSKYAAGGKNFTISLNMNFSHNYKLQFIGFQFYSGWKFDDSPFLDVTFQQYQRRYSILTQ